MKLLEAVLSKRKVIGWILFIGWIGFILWITLLSRKPLDQRIFRPDLFYEIIEYFADIEQGTTHLNLFFENILLFIPFGFLFPWKKNWWTVLIIGFGVSVLIESAQYVTMLGECEIDDIIANTIGALIGFGLYALMRKRIRSK